MLQKVELRIVFVNVSVCDLACSLVHCDVQRTCLAVISIVPFTYMRETKAVVNRTGTDSLSIHNHATGRVCSNSTTWGINGIRQSQNGPRRGQTPPRKQI